MAKNNGVAVVNGAAHDAELAKGVTLSMPNVSEDVVVFRRVSQAQLQAPIRMVGIAEDKELTEVKFKGIQMEWADNEGLYIMYKGQEAFVPHTNVKLVLFHK